MFAVVALVLIAIIFVGQLRRLLANPTVWPPDDFIEYWAAVRLTLSGENPYDPTLLLPLQQANGRQTDDAVMMWNPPWALAIVLPLGLLPAREAQLLWLGVNAAAMCFCGDRLWRVFGGSAERRWVGWAVALVAMPTLFALQSGQIGPLLLLGAVLFLECQRRGWHFAAGAATVLLAIKPHLAYLVWVAILCDAVARGRWRVVLGGAAVGLACSAVPAAFNSQVWQQYATALGNPPAQWISPTLGTVLRLAFGAEYFRLQFVPMIGGLIWFAWHRTKHAREWDWIEELPLLLLVSFVTAPYGAWPFDMVLLLPAAIRMVVTVEFGHSRAAAARETNRRAMIAKERMLVAGLVAVNLGCLVLNVLQISSFWFIWVSPAVLVLYAVGRPSMTVARSSSLVPA